MNPYRLKNVFEYLTSNNQLLKKKLKLGTSEIPIPPKRQDVTTIEAINRFNKANPRVDTTNLQPLSVKHSNVKKPDEPDMKAEGGRIGYKGAGLVKAYNLLKNLNKTGPVKGLEEKLIKQYKSEGMEFMDAIKKAQTEAGGVRYEAKMKIIDDAMKETNVMSDDYVDLLDMKIKLEDPDFAKDYMNFSETLKNKTRARTDEGWAEANFGDNYNERIDIARSKEINESIDPNITERSLVDDIDDMNIANTDEFFGVRKKNAEGGRIGYNQGSSLDSAVRTVDPVQDSGNKIEEVLKAYGRYQGNRKGKPMSFSKFFELYSTENFAEGGRAGYEDGGMLVQPSDDGSRPGYKGNIGQQKVSKEVSESSKKINKNINKWATNWFNKNQKNYGVRDFEKMKNDLTNAWSTELTENLKKYEGYGSAKKTLKMSDSGLPIIKDGISIDGIKFVTRADKAGNNPDLAWERLFYKNKLKNKDFKTQLKQYVEWATANKRKNPNLLDPNVKFGSAAQSKTGTLEYGKKFKGFNDDVIFFMGDVLNKKTLNPGGTIKGVTDVFKETLGKDADNYFKKFKGSWNVWVDNFKAVGKLAGLDDSMIDALLKKQTSDTQKIMKLYNVENLPLEFRVAQDHLFGLAEAKALGDPKIASQTLKNLVASTREQNRVLGQEGFSNKRVSLIKKFKNANLENKTNIINQLNTLADEYVPGRLKYNIKKDGSLKITNLQPEATLKAKTSAYESITETFPKNIKKLMAFCPAGTAKVTKAGGGRVPYADGPVCTPQEAVRGMNEEIDKIKKGKATAGQTSRTLNKLKTIGSIGMGGLLKAGLVSEVLYEAAIGFDKVVSEGQSPMQAFRQSYLTAPLRGIGVMKSFEEGEREELLDVASDKGKVGRVLDLQETVQNRDKLINKINNLETSLEDQQDFDDGSGFVGNTEPLEKNITELKAQLQDSYRDGQVNRADELFSTNPQDLKIKDQSLMDAYNNAIEKRAVGQASNSFKAQSIAADKNRIRDANKAMIDLGGTYQDYKNPFTKKEYEDFARQKGYLPSDKAFTDKYFTEAILNPMKFEQLMETPGFLGASEKFASGGIASLTKTIPPESGPTPQGLPYVYNNVKKI